MRVLLLFSGGVDSMVLAHMAHARRHQLGLLQVNYFHPASHKERAAVIEWRHRNRDKYVDTWCLSVPLWATALESGIGKKGPRIVPGRNAAFVALAVNLAATHDFDSVWIGASLGDRGYPDCTPEWIADQNEMARAFGVTVDAPLIQSSRAQVLEMATNNDWDLSLAWSCYQPRDNAPCGRCDSCAQ